MKIEHVKTEQLVNGVIVLHLTDEIGESCLRYRSHDLDAIDNDDNELPPSTIKINGDGDAESAWTHASVEIDIRYTDDCCEADEITDVLYQLKEARKFLKLRLKQLKERTQ